MKRGGKGPRQPGGGKQRPGPRHGERAYGRAGRPGRHDRDERASSFGETRAAKAGGRGKVGGAKFRGDDAPRAPKGDGTRARLYPTREGQGRPARAKGRSGGHASFARAERAMPPAAPPPPVISQALKEATKVQTVTVAPDETNMRVDRFFEARFPGLSFSHIQRIIRKGEVRVNGKRTEPKARLEAGQSVRIPPLQVTAPPPRPDAPQAQQDRAFIKSIVLYEDDDVMVLNKPMGLAVQGGSGTHRHIDGMLGALRGSHPDAQRPRLVHRLDKDTAGCLLIAKTRFAAAALAKTFRSRSARKIYWALVAGVPKPRQGRISTYLAKQEVEEDSFMRVAAHGEKDAVHAVTYYAVVETAAQKLAWLSLKPVTGRTHQLRAHMAHVGNPIVGDPKYFNIENWEFPGGIQNKLHLLARRIAVPHPRGGVIDVSAPLPPHMEQSWNLLGFDATRYDPIEDAPEEE